MNLDGVYINSKLNIQSHMKKKGIQAISMSEKISNYVEKKYEIDNLNKELSNFSHQIDNNDITNGNKFGDMKSKKNSIVKTNTDLMLVYTENNDSEMFICNVMKIGEIND